MNRFRIFLVPAILLAMATAVRAQEPRYAPAPAPASNQPESSCPAANWYFQAYQESAAALQRLRILCAAGQAASCCEGKAAAGAVKGCEVAQAPKACCCAKACACCETCKAKKDTAAACEWNPFAPVRVYPQPMPSTTIAQAAGITSQPYPTNLPVASYCVPPQCGTGTAQTVPVPRMNVVQVVMTTQANPVHFATPDLDAHCERMQTRGDVIVLEGNVVLLVKKHAQPIRVEAQRVLVNMRDGSFTVESDHRTMTTPVMRTYGVETPNMHFQFQVPATTPTPATPVRVIPVQPNSTTAPSVPLPAAPTLPR